MADGYTRERLERIFVDVAVIRTKVEGLEKAFAGFIARAGEQQNRLERLERRLFGLWLIGPLLVGAAVFLQNFKAWLGGR